jgi:hypothetical protein
MTHLDDLLVIPYYDDGDDDDDENDDGDDGDDDDDDLGARVDWSQIFLALGKNTELKTLSVDVYSSMDESLCAAMKYGLRMNETLESLEFRYRVPLLDENRALWNRAFSFLRTNKALKDLTVDMYVQHCLTTESCLSVFLLDIAAMLQENTTLESIFIPHWDRIKAEEFFVLVAALQHNITLKSLHVLRGHKFELNDDESKQMALLLKNNYALEILPDFDYEDLRETPAPSCD